MYILKKKPCGLPVVDVYIYICRPISFSDNAAIHASKTAYPKNTVKADNARRSSKSRSMLSVRGMRKEIRPERVNRSA